MITDWLMRHVYRTMQRFPDLGLRVVLDTHPHHCPTTGCLVTDCARVIVQADCACFTDMNGMPTHCIPTDPVNREDGEALLRSWKRFMSGADDALFTQRTAEARAYGAVLPHIRKDEDGDDSSSGPWEYL